MSTDDVLAYMAAIPKSNRPTELRSDIKMLAVWLRLREDDEFHNDVMMRHGLNTASCIDLKNGTHEHAISNAWGHAVSVLTARVFLDP